MCKKEFKYKCTKGPSPHVNIYWMLEGPHKIHLTNGDVYHINVLSACLDRKSRELWMVSSIYFQSCGVYWLNFILYSGSFSFFCEYFPQIISQPVKSLSIGRANLTLVIFLHDRDPADLFWVEAIKHKTGVLLFVPSITIHRKIIALEDVLLYPAWLKTSCQKLLNFDKTPFSLCLFVYLV